MFRECVLFISFILSGYAQENNVFLSPQSVDAWEGTNVTLTCTYNGTHEGTVHWNLSTHSKDYIARMAYFNNSCIVSLGLLSNAGNYSYNCTNAKVFNLIIKGISRQRHREKWTCIYDFGTLFKSSNTVILLVKVPVEVAKLSPYNSIYTTAENSNIYLQCATTQVRPKPNFSWYIDSDSISDGDKMEVIGDMSSEMIADFNVMKTFKFNRTWNARYLYCGANNRDKDFVFSQKIFLNITYPPDGPPRIGNQHNGSEINVIKGRLETLNCTVTTGNPPPRLVWNRHNDQPQSSSGGFETKRISWIPTGFMEEALTCQSIHPEKIDITYVTLNVLYPPEHVLINIQNKIGTFVPLKDSISVIEGRPFVLNCSANSKPAVSIYEWSGLIPCNSSYLHVSEGIKRDQVGPLICRVYNLMKLSESPFTISGSNSSCLDIDVLYPPGINPLKNMTLEEGEDLMCPCNATFGNPSKSTFIWKFGSKQWDTQQLDLKNVSRNQSGIYTCIVSNIMRPSNGDSTNGTDHGKFSLSVQYKAEVRMFLVEGRGAYTSVTVNENETVSLVCEIEGNPLPFGELLFQNAHFTRRRHINVKNMYTEFSEVLQLRSTFIAQCDDAGALNCTGRNTLYTEKKYITIRSLSLTVNCKPRKSPFHEIRDTVVSPTSVPTTITFATLAYPIPPSSGYVWSRNTTATMQIWIKIENYDTSYTIETSGLQSNLIIKNVSQFDFGLYRVEVRNDFGSYTHTFTLVSGGKPKVPTKLECIKDFTNETSATMQWMSGFNGGLDQTFFLKLRQVNGDVWQEANVTDQRSSRMIYTFDNLVSGTTYVFEIYASNKFGNSSSVNITFTTKIRQSSEKGLMSSSSTPLGAVVGGAIAATVVLVVFIIVLILYTKRKALSSQNTAMSDQYYNICDLKCVDFKNSLNCGSSNVYESLQNSGFDQHYEQISLVDCKLDKGEHKVYENLQLTRNADRHPSRESSSPGETVSVKEQTQSSA